MLILSYTGINPEPYTINSVEVHFMCGILGGDALYWKFGQATIGKNCNFNRRGKVSDKRCSMTDLGLPYGNHIMNKIQFNHVNRIKPGSSYWNDMSGLAEVEAIIC